MQIGPVECSMSGANASPTRSVSATARKPEARRSHQVMRTAFNLILAFLFAAPAFAQDMVLVGGTIIDGTGRARVRGNVRIRAGEIADIGTFQPARGETTLNVAGLIVAPGF